MNCIDKIQKCYRCGSDIQWESDFMTSDISDDFDKNDSSVTSYYHCPNCGASIELVDPSYENKKDYSFWNENYVNNVKN